MSEIGIGAWLALAGLGAIHGINPGMGWLFAVALGMQEGSARAVWRALPPLALGHAAAVGVMVGTAALLGLVVPPSLLRWTVVACLLGFGIMKLVRHRHPRYGGMRVNARQLATWSFLMATAHGAGLMVLPVVLRGSSAAVHSDAPGADHGHGAHMTRLAGLDASRSRSIAATVIHTLSYLFFTGTIALVVQQWLGLRFLRYAWLNLDVLWAGSLVLTALFTAVSG
jgi:hypothetical protein